MGSSGTVGNYTVYVNPFMVFQNFKYTKHFYIEGQRIVSKLGEMGVEQELLLPKSHAGGSLKNPVKWDSKKELSKDIIIANFEALGLSGAVFTAGKSGKVPYGQIKKYYRNADVVINPGTTATSGKKTEDLQFYYHPDHLGSSSYITDVSGEVYQHMEYFPFGETFIEERNDAEYTNYLYNGKELDEETGLYYYGARYYDARTSLFYGVDPLAEDFQRWDPYNYCMSNPVKNTDPTGMSTHTDADGNVVKVYNDNDLGIYKHADLSGWNKKDVLGKTGKGVDKMGTTLMWNSFTTRGKENKEAGKINFGSYEASNWIDNFESEIDNLIGADWDKRMQYAMNAGNGDIYDYKSQGLNENSTMDEIRSQMYRGSQISPGVYVSARDVGNFAAGAAARITNQGKMDFMLTAGGFQLSGNSKMGILFRTKHWQNEARKAGWPAYGEARESNFFQRLGFENVRTQQGVKQNSARIWR